MHTYRKIPGVWSLSYPRVLVGQLRAVFCAAALALLLYPSGTQHAAMASRSTYGSRLIHGLTTVPIASRLLQSPLRLRGGVEDVDKKEDHDERAERDHKLIQELQGMRSQCSTMAERITMITREVDDHMAVAQILKDYAPERACKRLVGGVLITSTVGDVLPAIEKETTMLSKAVADLSERLQEQRSAMEEFQSKHKIRISAAR